MGMGKVGKALRQRERGAGENLLGAGEARGEERGRGRESLSAPTEWHCRSVLRVRTLHAARCSQSTEEPIYAGVGNTGNS